LRERFVTPDATEALNPLFSAKFPSDHSLPDEGCRPIPVLTR